MPVTYEGERCRYCHRPYNMSPSPDCCGDCAAKFEGLEGPPVDDMGHCLSCGRLIQPNEDDEEKALLILSNRGYSSVVLEGNGQVLVSPNKQVPLRERLVRATAYVTKKDRELEAQKEAEEAREALAKIPLELLEIMPHAPCDCPYLEQMKDEAWPFPWGECEWCGRRFYVEHGTRKTSYVDPQKFGPHDYSAAPHQTSDCSYGCKCWAGPSASGGPVDPFGPCHKNPLPVCTCGEDDETDPEKSLPHKTWCPKAECSG